MPPALPISPQRACSIQRAEPAILCLAHAQVGDELHHVPPADVDNCCTRGCIGDYKVGTILNHGRVSIVRHRCPTFP
jgi:hypothetical protein